MTNFRSRASALITFSLIALAGSTLLSGSARAQVSGIATAPLAWQSEIGAAALAGSSGGIAVNSAAGTSNAQANMAAIAIGSGFAAVGLENRQEIATGTDFPRDAAAVIGTDAFRGARGIIAVNQSSGSANAQVNLAGIAVGPFSEVSLDQLGGISAASVDSDPGINRDSQVTRRAVVSDSAFVGAAGLVQLNQTAGMRNVTANVFALSIEAVPQ